MAGRLTRFLKVEQPHKADDSAPHHEVATRARFSGEPSGLATEPDFGEQPFLRCPRCEADNTRYAERCFNCQASLAGEAVREWNAQLWAARKAAEASAAGAQRVFGDATAPGDAHRLLGEAIAQAPVDAQRLLGEAIAQQVLERERARSWWWPRPVDPTPIAIQLLRLLPSDSARWIAGCIAAATFSIAALIAFTARQHPQLRLGGFIVSALLVLLFSPNLPSRRRW